MKPEIETALQMVLKNTLYNVYYGKNTWTPETVINIMKELSPEMQINVILEAMDEIVNEEKMQWNLKDK